MKKRLYALPFFLLTISSLLVIGNETASAVEQNVSHDTRELIARDSGFQVADELQASHLDRSASQGAGAERRKAAANAGSVATDQVDGMKKAYEAIKVEQEKNMIMVDGKRLMNTHQQ